MKNFRIFSASKKEFPEQTLVRWTYPDHSHIICNNTKPLAQVYNQFLIPAYKDDILIFCHDDCVIEDVLLGHKLNEAMNHYDIVGLAGIKAPVTIKPPCLWHLMGDRGNLSGAVAHFENKSLNKRFMTSFGPTPERVILLDGVFLAVNMERILEKGLKFDEKNPAGFHFYDLNFSMDANQLGLKLGTWPIWVTHESHGLANPSEDWLKGQTYLLEKYK